jgi:hypothetical protein
MIRNAMRFLAACLIVMALPNVAGAAELPTVTLSINGHQIVAEVATTPEQQATGLMHRFSLKPDHGMLFVFERVERRSFWMKNTFIPLSIASSPRTGIASIDDMVRTAKRRTGRVRRA